MKGRPETELARVVVTELQRQGYKTYEEVSLGSGDRRADIVAVRGPVVAVVECKMSLSRQLLSQLVAWRGRAHLTVGAVESSRRHGAHIEEYLGLKGIGLWVVYGNEIREVVAPRLFRRADVARLRRRLCAEQRSGQYAAAGSQGGYWTPFRATARELANVVKQKPGIELRDAIREISHHYSSARSALSSLPGLIRRGVVVGIRLETEGKRLTLYPEDAPLFTEVSGQ